MQGAAEQIAGASARVLALRGLGLQPHFWSMFLGLVREGRKMSPDSMGMPKHW